MVTNTMAILQRENSRLQADNQALRELSSRLYEFLDILDALVSADAPFTSDEALMPLLRMMFFRSLDLLNAPEGSLLLLDEETDEMVFVLVKGALAEHLVNYRIPADEGIAGWTMQHRKPALVRDVRHDTRFSDTIDETFKFRTQSIVAVPLVGDGKVFGVLEALNQPVDVPFSDLDVRLISLICRFAGELLMNVEQHN